MPTIQRQLEWEEGMAKHGVNRYRAIQDRAIEGGQPDTTSAGSRLLRAYVLQVSEQIELYLAGNHPEGRRRNKYAKLLDALNSDVAGLLTLKAVISSLFTPQTIQTLCRSIGSAVEDDLRFMKFRTENMTYYDEIIRSFSQRGSNSNKYKRAAVGHVAKSKGFEWEAWTKETHFGVGALLLSLALEVTDLVTRKTVTMRGRKEAMLVPSEECIRWVMEHNETMELMNPVRMPCLIPPAPWQDSTDGGYYSPLLRGRTPLVKGHRDKSGRVHQKLLSSASMAPVMDAVNAMQDTGWRVNAGILETMQEVWRKNLSIGMPRSDPYEIPACPLEEGVVAKELPEGDPRLEAFNAWKAEARELHNMEHERVGKAMTVSRTIRLASTMKDFEQFYYVYQLDFRGRAYAATNGLSPQGDDQGKALLQFARPQPLGDRGWYWLRVHGANKFGEDKGSYDERVSFIDDNRERWIAAATDPVANSSAWADADKPYQFLAFCKEYSEAVRQEYPESTLSRVPVALDGSCNGLQHFSAMLRDSVGGRSVNLLPGDRPADIYQDVADLCTQKLKVLRAGGSAGAINWLNLFQELHSEERMSRKVSKSPVMTMPYGSTRQTCTDTTFAWILDNAPDFFDKGTTFQHALYLAPILWESIGEVVVSARQAMDWIQNSASLLAKNGHPLQYDSPLGFPVYQASYKYETRQIETQIGGRLRLRLANDLDELSSRKQRQGSSPNLVHHADGTHMDMCLVEGKYEGIEDFAMIHDDFGVHATHIDKWHRIIRDCFVRLHEENDILGDFKRIHEERTGLVLPDLPPRGDLDLQEVKKSLYFFG